MKIDVPGRYPDREYNQSLLGNGVDLLYVDWSGAMCFKDQINGIFGYWYKLNRIPAEKHDLLPLLRVKYCLIPDFGPIEISASKQRFDPEKAILTSEIDAGPFQFTVTSFLTQEHLFVLKFKFKKFPQNGSIYFSLDDNRVTYTRKLVDCLSDPIKYYIKDKKIYAEYEHNGKFKFKGAGIMEVVEQKGCEVSLFDKIDEPQFGSVHDKSNKDSKNKIVFPYLTSGVLIRVTNLKKQSELICLTCLMDDMDCNDYMKKTEQTIENAKHETFTGIKKKHETFWKEYMSKSDIRINPDIDYQYKLSLYVLKAVQHREGGIIPSPFFPNNHGCLVYWDAMFDQMGYLRSNRFKEAEKISLLWLKGLEKARENAKLLKSKGAYYGWNINFNGYDSTALKTNQIHFNGDIAFSSWMYYLYSQDINYLRQIFPVIKETLDFLIDLYVEKNGNKIYVKSCESLDESAYERQGDTWTSSLIIQGIENLKKASNLLSEKIDVDKYEIIQKGLLKSLEENCEKGILYSYNRKDSLNVGVILSLIVLGKLKPSKINEKKTFQKFLKDAIESSGIGFGYSSRMRCEIFPWVEFMTTIYLAQKKDSRAEKYLSRGISATNSFGGIAEYIWEHGLISRQWYTSAHGTFLWALVEILVTASENNIIIFPAVPEEWGNIVCENLMLPGNIQFSVEMRNGKIKKVYFKNNNDKSLDRIIFYKDFSKNITLPPGEIVRFL